MNDQTEDLLDPPADGVTAAAPAPGRALPGLRAMAGPLFGVALVSLGIGFLLARNVSEESAAGLASRTVTTPPATRAVAGTTASASAGSTATTGGTSSSTGTSTTNAPVTTVGVIGPNRGATASSATGAAATGGSSPTTTPTTEPATSTTGVASTVASTTVGVAGTTAATAPPGPTQAPTTKPSPTTTRPATTTTRAQPTTTRPPATTLPGPPYVAAVNSAGPIGYWRLDEPSGGSAADQSGNGRTGVYAGGFLTNQGGALAHGAGRAVLFESGAVELPDAAALRLNGAFTIEFWARLDRFQNTWPGLLVKGSAAGPDGYLVYYDPSGRVVLKRNNVEVASAPGAIRTDGFTHLAVTYDGTTVRWYADGVLSSSKSVSYPANNGNAVLAIGRGDQYGVHTLDEVAIYGSALSASTLQAHVDAARR